jgi:hypothetical protein
MNSWDSIQFFRFCRIPARFHHNHCSWFAGITVEDMLGTKKLLLRAFWEKVPTLRDFETLGGVYCEFLNIGGRIKNRPKLQGVIRTFPQIKY